jgi:hypothetical protein
VSLCYIIVSLLLDLSLLLFKVRVVHTVVKVKVKVTPITGHEGPTGGVEV